MRFSLGIATAAMLLAGCDGWRGNGDEADEANAALAAKATLERVLETCASKLTYVRLKEYVFDQAAQIRNTDTRRLDPLAAHSVVRMDRPLVKSRDDHLNITVCTGRFVLNLPPGVHDAFGGQPVIAANVEYAAQAAADGSGLVYSMTGAEPIIYRIATLGLPNQPQSQIAAAPKLPESEPEIEPAATRPEPKPIERQAEPTRTATIERKPKAHVEERDKSTAVANPSFNCRHARTRSEKAICGSGSLAAADRRMSAAYYAEMARADSATKRALRQSRDSFLAKRERCSSDACVAQAYQQRVAEIRRIAAGQ